MAAVLQTTYRDGRDASRLLAYIERDTALRNRFGDAMSDRDVRAFIEKSRRHMFERDMILSPENGHQLSNEEFSLHTRQIMGEFLEDRPTVDYCYAVHRDTDHPHVHVALTGERRDLYMDREDIRDVRALTNERMVEQHRARTQALDQAVTQAQEDEQEQAHDRERDRDGWSR
ncbi:relaxase/mobilization nuclease domain-containing protein [Halomarina pelagica]|uniref:relaxase/mobilization nuclease domain-containing protein n=1 Tax=Halomarina pelagica TaxID=2961599 RepID=UPI0020C3B420|nr:relaxase [Halomarina sp. BND7]